MPMSPSNLAASMEFMTPTDQENLAINAFADAWESFFSQAQCGPIPIVPIALAAPKSAMIAAMTGLSVAGAASILSGITAWWTICVANAAVLFPTALLITPPPGLAALTPALIAAFTANTLGKLELGPACDVLAAILYSTGGLGGMAIIPTPTPTPTPIL